jgi:4-alpha-glucanotransferase
MKKKNSGVPTLKARASGVLLHPTSLANEFPIGDLGPAAYAFADFLYASKQRWWQMLPVSPVGPGFSPYQSLSAFAGARLLISPELLARDGFLKQADLAQWKSEPRARVDFVTARETKENCLRHAFHHFEHHMTRKENESFQRFCRAEHEWLEDYALFESVRRAEDGRDWTSWPFDLRSRRRPALKAATEVLARETAFQKFVQWQFATQWFALKAYCTARGIGLIGDVPIFVAPNSADVWAHPNLFQLNRDGTPRVVAGVPPDYFSKTGQRWGNPHYRWEKLRGQGYRWWIQRFRKTLQYFDAVRLDHFIGFVRYYEVPGHSETAENGRYRKGPGADFFRAVLRALGPVQLIAEDLGVLTPAVKALRDEFMFPGMRVLQFAFGADPEAANYQPHSFIPNCVVYTGTHDNDTTVGWFNDKESSASTRSKEEIEKERKFVLNYLHSDGREIHWDMIRMALSSVANTAIFPAQDLLGLGANARMNRPGTAEGNWDWRLKPDELTDKIAARLRSLTETYAR